MLLGDLAAACLHFLTAEKGHVEAEPNTQCLSLLRRLGTPHVPLAKKSHDQAIFQGGKGHSSYRELQQEGSESDCERITECTQTSDSTRFKVKHLSALNPSSPKEMLTVLRQVLQAMS